MPDRSSSVGFGISPDIARAMRLDTQKGALIAQVDRSGNASRAGLRQGDVVRSFAGKPVDGPRDLARLVAGAKAGSSVCVTVLRDGKSIASMMAIGGDDRGDHSGVDRGDDGGDDFGGEPPMLRTVRGAGYRLDAG